MKVVLLKAVSKLGKRGEVKNVADGFFRNFLHPRTLAVNATPGRIAQAEDRKQRAAATMETIRKNAAEIAKKLSGSVVSVSGKSTPKGKLYAAISISEILKATEAQLGLKLTESALLSHDPIKKVGKTLIALQLSDEVKANLTVEVAATK